jgi:competence protein ComEC
VLLRTRHHLLLVRRGTTVLGAGRRGAARAVAAVAARGEARIDLLVLSQRDTDHVGGAASLLAQMPVAALSSSLSETHPLRSTGVPHRRCAAGQSWDWDGVRFEVLQPRDAGYLPSARRIR